MEEESPTHVIKFAREINFLGNQDNFLAPPFMLFKMNSNLSQHQQRNVYPSPTQHLYSDGSILFLHI